MKTKRINLSETKNGLNYFYIYEVVGKKMDGEFWTITRCLTEKEAKETAETYRDECFANMFKYVFTERQLVWI